MPECAAGWFKGAIVTLMAMAVGVPVAADAEDGSINERMREAGKHWADACAGSEVVERRVGPDPVGESVYATGMRVLTRYTMADRLDKLGEAEACLSMVASAETRKPVIVITKSEGDENQAGAGSVYEPGQKAFARRLQRLDVGRIEAGVRAAETRSTPDNPFPQQSLNHQFEATAMMGYELPRSFSSGFVNHCLVGLAPQSFEQHLAGYPPELAGALPEKQRRWLVEHGDAMEFWHEVGHCQWNAMTASDHSRVSEHDQQPFGSSREPACSQSQRSKPTPRMGQRERPLIERMLQRGASTQAIARQARSQVGAGDTDDEILQKLVQEASADSYAYNQLRKRFDQRMAGCRQTPQPNPWSRFRLMSSVHQPRSAYMGWMMPFLAGEDETVQHQIIADAWKGLRDVAFNRYADIERPMQVLGTDNPAAHFIDVPQQHPDAERADNWRRWIEHWLTHQPDNNLSGKSDSLADEG